MRASAFRSFVLCGLVGISGTVGGCGPSRPGRVTPPAVDVDAVTAAVMSRADADGDGMLAKQELGRFPSLAAALVVLDADADGRLSAAELRAWLDDVKGSRVALTPLTVSVTRQQKPVAAATVRLTPEAFMGGDMKAAEGVTDVNGDAVLRIPESPYPGVHPGLYRVEITGTGPDGMPLPARYNIESTLGVAVGGRVPEYGRTLFTLE